MLVNFDKTGRVIWYNLYVSKEAAESCLSDNTIWQYPARWCCLKDSFQTTPSGWILPCPLFPSQRKALWSI